MTDNFTCKVSADLFRRAAICASKEQTRYYLVGVQVEPCSEGGVLLIATDGARMVCLRDPDGSASGNAIISTDPDLLKAAAGKHAMQVLVENNRARVETANDCPLWQGVANALVDGHFPEWRRVVPKATEERKLGTFNAALLQGLGLALASDPKKPLLSMYSDDTTCPALVRGTLLAEAFGVIMPERDDRNVVLPNWASRGTEQQAA